MGGERKPTCCFFESFDHNIVNTLRYMGTLLQFSKATLMLSDRVINVHFLGNGGT